GVIFINNNVIVTLKGTSFDKPEAPTELVELREINAGESVKARKRLNHGASSECNMCLLHEERQQVLAHGRRTEADDGGRRRPHHNVRPYSACTPCGLIQSSITDANQRQDHRDLDTDGQHAQERPDRSMPKVLKNKSVEQ